MALAMGGRSSRPGGGSSSGYGGSSSGTLSTSGTTPLSVGEGVPGGGTVTSVPEIDASTGLLALAAVLAVVAFVWERNRRLRA
ncbi:MAG: VPEID-CTERM sorting domain-containing protein [Rhodobacterales bacterium]|nr:VPEID-CTERM sorting domain-containing protein [Rhodobacterales bacterium]MDX5389207.1 VPEID-CTERM sorting domain-containing protein [Rhodobacterales bacterium]MDX5488904.1 VPEID-CTERM sorting domain-containing protein [Rhodobacterales bacterium]